MAERLTKFLQEPRSLQVLRNLSLVLSIVEEAKADGVTRTGAFSFWEDRLIKLCYAHSPKGYIGIPSGYELVMLEPKQLHKSCVNWWRSTSASWKQPQFDVSNPLAFWQEGSDAFTPDFLAFLDNIPTHVDETQESASSSVVQLSVDQSKTQSSSGEPSSNEPATRPQSLLLPQGTPIYGSVELDRDATLNARHHSRG
ncbi:hypothetical protein LTR95_008283 [Oleoguttula sp. CCFEE 5521]